VRCGKSLEAKIVKWLDEHQDGEVPRMDFKTKEIKRVHGYTDIIVK